MSTFELAEVLVCLNASEVKARDLATLSRLEVGLAPKGDAEALAALMAGSAASLRQLMLIYGEIADLSERAAALLRQGSA